MILTRASPSEVCKLLVRQVLPLFFAHVNEQEPIEGRTRLQKMLFLLSQEYSETSFQYRFYPFDYGPYSSTLQSDLDMLIENNFLDEKLGSNLSDRRKYRYSIMVKGTRIVERALDLGRFLKMYESCGAIKNHANHMNLDDLLAEIYSKYPYYAKSSIYQF